MPALESLPRELRQQIFKFAFDHAIYEDHQLNDNIRTCIRRFDGVYRVENEFQYSIQSIMGEVLGPGARFSGHSVDTYPKLHAPHIHNLASALLTVYPETGDDMMFVLEKGLARFEEDHQKTLKKCGEEDEDDEDDAIRMYSRRAQARRHLLDTGTNTYVPMAPGDVAWRHAGRLQRLHRRMRRAS